jgi:integrase
LREVRALRPGEAVWDTTVVGFGIRRQQSDAISYVVFYRTAEGRQRWFTIGRHGSPWMPETARDEALRLLGEVARGGDPAADKRGKRASTTLVVADLCGRYLADAEAGRLLTRRRAAKKPSTLVTDRGRITRHIVPLLGHLPVAAVTRGDVEAFMHAVAEGETAGRTKTKPRGVANIRGGRGAASRTVGLLGAIFTYAVRHEMRPDNPVHGVARYADGRRERRLREEEYAALGAALLAAEDDGMWPPAVAAARFMVMTGWRRGEVLGLRWPEVDLARRTARLADTKTGTSTRPLSEAACMVLRMMLQAIPPNGTCVFPARYGDLPIRGYPKYWARIAHRMGGLPADITPHVLRHSFASLAADLGYSEPTIAAMIGHQGRTITSRYLHAADAVLLAAADAVAERAMVLMGNPAVPQPGASKQIASAVEDEAAPAPGLDDGARPRTL